MICNNHDNCMVINTESFLRSDINYNITNLLYKGRNWSLCHKQLFNALPFSVISLLVRCYITFSCNTGHELLVALIT